MPGSVTCTLAVTSRSEVVYSEPARLKEIPGALGSIETDRCQQLTLDWLARRVAHGDAACEAEEIQILGRHLFEVLFHDAAIRTEFLGLVAQVRSTSETLCVHLTFADDATELARLPWEFLYVDLGGAEEWFLAAEADFVLTRFLSAQAPVPQVPAERPLKVLIAACIRDATRSELAEIAEIRELVGFLARHRTPGAGDGPADVEVRELADPTYGELRAAIRDESEDGSAGGRWTPDVVHIIGHGEPGALRLRRDPVLVASDRSAAETALLANRQPSPVSEEQPVEAGVMAELFGVARPRLVFLQTCHGSAPEADLLYATADRVVAAGVPAVLAMQYDIDRGAADKFAVAVYERLLAGATVGAAVVAGRQVLRSKDSGAPKPYRAFGTPVVYLGADGALLAPRPSAGAGARTPGPGTDNTICPRCQTPCRYRNCPTCRLYFDCRECGLELESPLGAICGSCASEIRQVPDPRVHPPEVPPSPTVEIAQPATVTVLTDRSQTGARPEAGGPAAGRRKPGGGYPA